LGVYARTACGGINMTRTFIKKLIGVGYSHKRARSICYWHIKNRRAIESNKTQYMLKKWKSQGYDEPIDLKSYKEFYESIKKYGTVVK
jgi:hypothetical protein